MTKENKSPTVDSREFLESLKLDGIEEIYIEPHRTPAARKPASTITSKVQPTTPSSPAKVSTKPKMLSKDAAKLKDEMIALRDTIQACTLCSELSSTRKNTVFGSGNIRADLMFVGEAPGADEDEQGLPFVGRAGKLLTKIIESIGLERKQVFIANMLKCRPPANRPPKPEEKQNCNSYLKKQLDLIQPKIIVALGKHAAQGLLETEEPISKLRGEFRDFHGIKLMSTYHPAYLLRSPGEKVKVWEDMQKVRDELLRLKG